METIFVLLYMQVAGIALCCFTSYFTDRRKNRRKSFRGDLAGRRLQQNPQLLIEYFQEHPESSLQRRYPELYTMAQATLRYKEINRLKTKGSLSDKEYENRLEKILSLIDIDNDLKCIQYK